MRLLRTRLAAVPFLYNFEEKSRWTIQFEVGIVAAAFAIASFLWKFSFAKNRGFEGGKFAMYSFKVLLRKIHRLLFNCLALLLQKSKVPLRKCTDRERKVQPQHTFTDKVNTSA